jgi:NAD(P)-dependent dehydrogenase (short-subunit alcohol dehydrogenase family)
MNSNVERPVALITGANKGIGRETALQLGALGYIALIGSRDEVRGKSAAAQLRSQHVEAQYVHLDVTKVASIRGAAAAITARYHKLDALINNAGILREADFDRRASSPHTFLTPPSEVSLKVLRETFATNCFGAVSVTNHMLPLIKRSVAGRIVNVSSRLASLSSTQLHSPGHLAMLAYLASKSALNSATVQYAYELRDTNIKVNSAAPAHCATDINAHFGEHTAAESAHIIVRLATLGSDGPTGGFFSETEDLPW